MTNLVPEKRLDKNGVLTTKHVRATPRPQNALSGVPAPSLGTAVAPKRDKSAQKAFKPRASQTKQQNYAIDMAMAPVSSELREGDAPSRPQSHYFGYKANEVEVYAVLGVADPGDAAKMLSKGVRTAEEAVSYMKEHNAGHLIRNRTKFAAEALRRGISSYDFMERLGLSDVGNPDDDSSPYAMDALELSTYASLSDQYAWVNKKILSGSVSLEDIKTLGVSKLKTHRRLYYSIPALEKVHDPEAKFSMDDLKYLVDRASSEKTERRPYSDAVEYMVAEGTDGIKKLESLKLLSAIMSKHRIGAGKHEHVTYEIDFRQTYDHYSRGFPKSDDLIALQDAGVSAERAAELMNDGMDARSVIAVEDGTEKALAGGWL